MWLFTSISPPPTSAFNLLICHFSLDSFRFQEILKGHVRTYCSYLSPLFTYLICKAPDSYIDLMVPYGPRSSILSIRRLEAGYILAIRSGYRDFTDYYTRFHYVDALLYCSCGRKKSPLYFYFCCRGKAATPLLGPLSEKLQ